MHLLLTFQNIPDIQDMSTTCSRRISEGVEHPQPSLIHL